MQMEEERGTARSSTKPYEPEAAVAGLDRLTAGFAANNIGGRIEGGYRFAIPGVYQLPGFGSNAVAGGGPTLAFREIGDHRFYSRRLWLGQERRRLRGILEEGRLLWIFDPAADIAFSAIGAQLSKLLRLSECPAAQWDDTVQIRCMGCRMVFPSGVQSSC